MPRVDYKCSACGATGPLEDFAIRVCRRCGERRLFCRTYCACDESGNGVFLNALLRCKDCATSQKPPEIPPLFR